MDEDNDLSASVVRNLDVVVSAYRHLDRVDKRFLEAIMWYLRELTDELDWHLGGMDSNSDLYGFVDHWFCPTSWVNEGNPDDTEIYFDICAEEPEGEDLHWATCLIGALGDESAAMIKCELPKLPKRYGNRNFLAREDITSDVSALGFEINGSEVQRRVVIDREALAKAFENDDGEDINDGFRTALSPLGDAMRDLAKQNDAWNAVRAKFLEVAGE